MEGEGGRFLLPFRELRASSLGSHQLMDILYDAYWSPHRMEFRMSQNTRRTPHLFDISSPRKIISQMSLTGSSEDKWQQKQSEDWAAEENDSSKKHKKVFRHKDYRNSEGGAAAHPYNVGNPRSWQRCILLHCDGHGSYGELWWSYVP